jgi:hypothetical protein
MSTVKVSHLDYVYHEGHNVEPHLGNAAHVPLQHVDQFVAT